MSQQPIQTSYVINEKVKIKIPHPIRNVLISGVVLLILLGIAGVIYTYKYGANDSADKVTTPRREQAGAEVKVVQPGPNAPVGASITYISTPVKRGDNTIMNIHTNPKATCTISVTYNNVVSKDSGLNSKVADARGSVAWSWTVDASAAPGKWPAKVICSVGKKSAMVIGNLEVQ